MSIWFEVAGLGFRIQGSGSRFDGLHFGGQESGVKIGDSVSYFIDSWVTHYQDGRIQKKNSGCGLRVQVPGSRVQGSKA